MDHEMTASDEQQLIAAHLAEKGVTKCPPRVPRGAPKRGRFNPNASSQLPGNVIARHRARRAVPK